MKLLTGFMALCMAVMLCASADAADTFKDESAMRAFTDKVMEKAGKGDLKAAFEVIKPYVRMNDVDFESNVSESTQLRQKYALQYGPSKNYAFVGSKKAGALLYRLQYLEVAEKQALVWSFYFLKVNDAWRLDEFDYTPQLSVLFREQ